MPSKWGVCSVHVMLIFLFWPKKGVEHAGIVYGAKNRFTIGEWVRYIRRLHATKGAEDVRNLVFFVERW